MAPLPRTPLQRVIREFGRLGGGARLSGGVRLGQRSGAAARSAAARSAAGLLSRRPALPLRRRSGPLEEEIRVTQRERDEAQTG